jgi:hypothetical protein
MAKPTKSKAKTLVQFYHTWLDEVLDDAIRSLDEALGYKGMQRLRGLYTRAHELFTQLEAGKVYTGRSCYWCDAGVEASVEGSMQVCVGGLVVRV